MSGVSSMRGVTCEVGVAYVPVSSSKGGVASGCVSIPEEVNTVCVCQF